MVFSLYLVVVTTTAGLTGEENSQDKVFHPGSRSSVCARLTARAASRQTNLRNCGPGWMFLNRSSLSRRSRHP